MLISDIEALDRRVSNYDTSKGEMFDYVYAFTNENSKDAINLFNLKNKACLSVLASSDQIFDMYLNGANKVETFDINPYTKYYFYLKKALLLAKVSKEEYFDFLSADLALCRNRKSFSKQEFDKIKNFITDKESYLFWTYVYDHYDPSCIRHKYLFNRDEWPYTILQKSIGYLDDENFKKIEDLAEDIDVEFHNCNFTDLKEKIADKFDFIYLSNIMQYALDIYEEKVKHLDHSKIRALDLFKKDILNLDAILKENGIIANYIYDSARRSRSRIVDLRRGVFVEDYFQEESFTSIQEIVDKEVVGFTDDLTRKDACLIYHK